MAYKCADTRQLLKLALKSKSLSREHFRELKLEIDPEGVHIVWMSMLHNDIEVRTMWYVKMKGVDMPHRFSLDLPLAVFNKLPSVEAPAEAEDE